MAEIIEAAEGAVEAGEHERQAGLGAKAEAGSFLDHIFAAPPAIRRHLIASFALYLGGAVVAIGGIWWDNAGYGVLPKLATAVGVTGFVAGAFYGLVVISYQRFLLRQKKEQVEEDAEKEARANPQVSKFAWDAARRKFESYLDRNLSQVSSIYRVVVSAMIVGGVLIGIGVWRAIVAPAELTGPLLPAVSGVILQFIAGTFLVIYRATMEQATRHVEVLERINAVGMSISILDAIEGDPAVRNSARVEIARELLGLYGRAPASAGAKEGTRTRRKPRTAAEG